MQTAKAIIIGAIMWILGASIYSASYYIQILDNTELQAMILLALAVVPIAWVGASYFFRREPDANSLVTAIWMVGTATVLDAAITVPFVIIPHGGNYLEFFGSLSFWTIAGEYLTVILICAAYQKRALIENTRIH